MKRNISIAGLVILLYALNSFATAAKADFSGSWTMDKSRTEGLPPDVEQTMTIKQTGDTLDIVTKVTADQGDQTVPVTYVLDGKEVEYKTTRQGLEGKGKRTAKWAGDGNGFEVNEEETLDGPMGTVTVQFARKWTMQEDGKTLVITMDIKGPNGSQTVKRTFVKK
jgi:hypothetical protein